MEVLEDVGRLRILEGVCSDRALRFFRRFRNSSNHWLSVSSSRAEILSQLSKLFNAGAVNNILEGGDIHSVDMVFSFIGNFGDTGTGLEKLRHSQSELFVF